MQKQQSTDANPIASGKLQKVHQKIWTSVLGQWRERLKCTFRNPCLQTNMATNIAGNHHAASLRNVHFC